jgi:insertion element IS1 protein InsB
VYPGYGPCVEDQPHHGNERIEKKESSLSSVNKHLLALLDPDEVEVVIRIAEEAEVDEMWSFVKRKKAPHWLWHAIDHRSGKVLAYVFGRRQDEVLLKLQALLEPFGITRYYADYWGPYTRHIEAGQHQPGKRNTQQIERKHLTLRTRIKRLTRKTICFSKSIQMHDIVIGLLVKRYEFGLTL